VETLVDRNTFVEIVQQNQEPAKYICMNSLYLKDFDVIFNVKRAEVRLGFSLKSKRCTNTYALALFLIESRTI